jgi:hypothetical protein
MWPSDKLEFETSVLNEQYWIFVNFWMFSDAVIRLLLMESVIGLPHSIIQVYILCQTVKHIKAKSFHFILFFVDIFIMIYFQNSTQHRRELMLSSCQMIEH